MSQRFCFCTLAVGRRYRTHAQLLAQDLSRYAPDFPFVILSDRPQAFAPYPNVIAHQHRLTSILGYHDKRQVIERAIADFETCLFMDSDVRILGTVPHDIDFPPGLTGRFGCSILKHNKPSKFSRSLPLIQKIAEKLDLPLETTIWLHEFMFAVRRQAGVEQAFLHHWRLLAYYFQWQGVYSGEGNVMGLAAALSGFHTGFKRTNSFAFFKDCIEKELIKTGKVALTEATVQCFQTQQSIELPQTTWQKIMSRWLQFWGFHYRLTKFKIVASQDKDFHHLLALLN
ncbi:MAG TPA: hypothetical protein V6D02_04100 [Candidatus Obscuribacterales bacterium]